MQFRKDNYEKLYEQVKAGKRVVCYVDYDACLDGSLILRDIYTRYIDPEKNEQEIFLSECQRRNVEWLDESEPAPSPEYNRDENSPQGKAAIAFYNWMESASMSNAKIPLEIKWRMFADQKNAKK